MTRLVRFFVAVVPLCLMLSAYCFAGDDKKNDRYAVTKEDTFIYYYLPISPDAKSEIIGKDVQVKIIDENWYRGKTWYYVESNRPNMLGYLEERFLRPVNWSFKRDPFFQFNPQTEFGIMVLGISLSEKADFAKGNPQSFKYCPNCKEPSHPAGPVFYLGQALNIRIASKAVLGGGVLYNSVPKDFRSGFTDRQPWPAPKEGEAYTYTRLSSLGHVIPYVSLGYMGTFDRESGSKYHGSYEFGVRWLRLEGLTLEQGFDRYNNRDPIRTLIARKAYTTFQGYYFDVRYHRKKIGVFATVVIISPASVDFQEYGSARIHGGAFSTGLSIKF